MFERYTDRARRCIVLAQEEARMLSHPVIDVDHLLAGLAREGEGVAAQALGKAGLDLEGIQVALGQLHPAGSTAPLGHMPFTNGVRRALEDALRESIGLATPYVGTEHLLLGVLRYCDRHPGGVTAAALEACGTSPAQVREAVMVLLRGYGDVPAEPAEAEGDPFAPLLAAIDGIRHQVEELRRQQGAPG